MSKKVDVEQSAVLEALQATINKQAGKPDALQFVSDIWDAPFVPPPADVKPVVQGEWIYKERHEHYPSGKSYTARYCGVCGRRDHNEDSDYCGYCGADMRKEEDDE